MRVHSIRLRGPWLCRPVRLTGGTDVAARTVEWPLDWRVLFGAAAGVVAFERTFNRPTNLGPHERVWLKLADAPPTADTTLNGVSLGVARCFPVAWDVTSLLADGNRLRIEIDYDPARDDGPAAGLTGLVSLEIHTPEPHELATKS